MDTKAIQDVPEKFHVGAWTVRPDLNRIRHGAHEVRLEPKLMDLLVCLARRPGRVVQPQQIVEEVWRCRYVGQSALSRSVALLRRALGDDARDPRYIETISKRGYRMVATVEGLPAAGSPVPTSPWCVMVIGAAEVPLSPGENLIGRGSGAVIRIDSPLVSRRHAAVEVRDGRAVLADLGSAAGTVHCGRPVHEPVELGDGETIRVGPLLMVFRVLGHAAGRLSDARQVDDRNTRRPPRKTHKKRGRSEQRPSKEQQQTWP